MDELVFMFILLVACAIVEPHTGNWEHNKGARRIRDVQGRPKEAVNPDSTAPHVNVLKQFSDQLDHAQSNLAYCEFGGYLEYISLQCEPQKFLNLRNGISDVDKPPDLKMMALLTSAIAVGCKETALFLSQLLIQNSKKQNEGSQMCISSTIRGPKENELNPCDGKTAELIREQFRPYKKLTLMYHITSSPLFLTLGCHSLGKVSVEDLSLDLNLNNTNGSRIQNMTVFNSESNSHDKDTLIMNYVYQHKSDIQFTESLIQSTEKTGHSDTDNLKAVDGVNFTSKAIQNRPRRSAGERNIEDLFTVQYRCSIVGSLGVLLDSVSKSACLQFCVDDESCRSVGYTNDHSQWCQLNTEIKNEVGPFFACGRGESSEWDYFEKKSDPVYFLISSKSRGDVLQAASPNSVHIKDFNGNDNQFWFWKDDNIYSKKYPQRVLSINIKQHNGKTLGDVVLKNNHDTKTQKWNFANEALTSQYENLLLDIKDGIPKVTQDTSLRSQKWSLSLDRFYFVITCRHSGKVLDVNKKHQSEVRVTMWSYHGGDNQLWFWDDDSIRSKSFPGKVLDLHMSDYLKDGWGKVYLYTFHGGTNQRWEMKGDNLISTYKNLRLDVRYSNQEDGAVVGGYGQNGNPNQRWTFGTYRNFFFILNKKTGKVIDATSDSVIKHWHYHGGKNQIWFWDGHVIRNKQYINRVIDFNVEGSVYGNLFLNNFKGTQSQEWIYDDNEMLLVSALNNLTLEVPHESSSDGAVINVKARKTQKWSLTPEHDFFTITSRQNTKVLDATLNSKVTMWYFHGGDNQLWFWDGDNIRSKKFPQKVLDIHMRDYQRQNWGKVYLHIYNGGDNQRWGVNGDQIISVYKNLRLDIRHSNTANGAEVGGNRNTGHINQMWSQNAKERIFFTVKAVKNEKVLDAFGNFNIGIWTYNGGDNQLWYWDKDTIRSKKYPDKVVDLHMADFNKNGWGKVYLHRYNSGQNQKWKIEGEKIICKFRLLYLDIFKGSVENGALVGGYPRTDNDNQRWVLGAAHDKGTSTKSCVDKTEKDIYNVVQWVPLVSTLWDLFSSIGYAATGCTTVAEERAVSFAIGTVMDVATIATGGAAAGLSTVVKTGVKDGIKFGLKQGMKATVKITQQSIKHLVESATKTIAQSGIRKTISQVLKKSGKLLIRETIVEPAMFLKNVGKISRKILTHPVKTFKQSWKAASKKIDDLKQLKKTVDELRQSGKTLPDGSSYKPKVRCKRGNKKSCLRVENGYSKDQESLYQDILDSNAVSENVDTCAIRYMALTERQYSTTPRHIKDKMDQLNTNAEKAELFAAYQYTDNSAGVNMYAQKILDGQPLHEQKEFLSALSKSVDELYDQTVLLQSYLNKHPLENPKTVYRFERQFTDELYEHDTVYTSKRFMSTTGTNERIKDTGIDLTSKSEYPIELTIHLQKSGVDLSDISKYPTQDELLIPIGTQFKVRKEIVDVEGFPITRVTLTEI